MNRFIDRNIRWIFPLPAVLFVMVMMAFPLCYTFYMSLTDWSMSSQGIRKFIGLGNYIGLFMDEQFLNACRLTIYFTVLTLFTETILGIIIALMLNREFTGKRAVKTILLLPMVTTPVAIGLAWTLFYEPTIGLGNQFLKLLGLPVSKWLASETTVIPSIAIVDVWEWTPMIILVMLAGLASLPAEPYESARVDGATYLQTTWYITLPLLLPTIFIAIILRGIDAFKTFDIIYTMTGGGPGYASQTLNIYAYNLSFGYFRFGYASTVLLTLFILLTGFCVLMIKMRKMGSKRL